MNGGKIYQGEKDWRKNKFGIEKATVCSEMHFKYSNDVKKQLDKSVRTPLSWEHMYGIYSLRNEWCK